MSPDNRGSPRSPDRRKSSNKKSPELISTNLKKSPSPDRREYEDMVGYDYDDNINTEFK